MPLHVKRHLIYIAGSVNYLHSRRYDMHSEKAGNALTAYWMKERDNGVGFAANGGYDFKLTEHWSVGARCYFYHFNDAHVMGLLNVGIAF